METYLASEEKAYHVFQNVIDEATNAPESEHPRFRPTALNTLRRNCKIAKTGRWAADFADSFVDHPYQHSSKTTDAFWAEGSGPEIESARIIWIQLLTLLAKGYNV